MGKARLRMLMESFAMLGRMRRGEPVAPKPAGMACAANPDAKPRAKRLHYVILPKPTGRGFVSLGPMQAREASQEWVKMADERAAKPIGHPLNCPDARPFAQRGHSRDLLFDG